MAGCLTIGETYFFRENRSFEILAEEIIPEIILKRRGGEQRLRIWSAGSSTGEEPYSMAILLHRMNNVLKEWNISILATDINPKALRKAVEGVYTEWSFRNPPSWLKENYFRKSVDGLLKLISPIKKMVNFSYLNLVEDCYPSLSSDTNAMDVIFCRNVLMYFTPELAGKVVERFHRSLVDGGWLVVSPCEASQVSYPQFKAVSFPGAVFYQKQAPGIELRGNKNPEPKVRFTTPLIPLFQPLPSKPTSAPLKPLPAILPPVPLEQTDFKEALALYNKGLYPEAETMLAPLLPPNHENVKANVLLCRIRANQGKLAEALTLLEQAITADKLNPGLHYLRAMILQEQGSDNEASISLKRALYLDRNLVIAHVALANLALRLGKHKEYRKYLENALSILGGYQPDEILPESEGMTAGRLMKIIGAMDVMGGRNES
jgi:chemotaxis protein methyltransferase CheR